MLKYPASMDGDIPADAKDENPLENIEEHEYPSGCRFAAIVTALVLSIFLASLDTVRQRENMRGNLDFSNFDRLLSRPQYHL